MNVSVDIDIININWYLFGHYQNQIQINSLQLPKNGLNNQTDSLDTLTKCLDTTQAEYLDNQYRL